MLGTTKVLLLWLGYCDCLLPVQRKVHDVLIGLEYVYTGILPMDLSQMLGRLAELENMCECCWVTLAN